MDSLLLFSGADRHGMQSILHRLVLYVLFLVHVKDSKLNYISAFPEENVIFVLYHKKRVLITVDGYVCVGWVGLSYKGVMAVGWIMTEWDILYYYHCVSMGPKPHCQQWEKKGWVKNKKQMNTGHTSFHVCAGWAALRVYTSFVTLEDFVFEKHS